MYKVRYRTPFFTGFGFDLGQLGIGEPRLKLICFPLGFVFHDCLLVYNYSDFAYNVNLFIVKVVDPEHKKRAPPEDEALTIAAIWRQI